jgi:hypothetical protein
MMALVRRITIFEGVTDDLAVKKNCICGTDSGIDT